MLCVRVQYAISMLCVSDVVSWQVITSSHSRDLAPAVGELGLLGGSCRVSYFLEYSLLIYCVVYDKDIQQNLIENHIVNHIWLCIATYSEILLYAVYFLLVIWKTTLIKNS